MKPPQTARNMMMNDTRAIDSDALDNKIEDNYNAMHLLHDIVADRKLDSFQRTCLLSLAITLYEYAPSPVFHGLVAGLRTNKPDF
jgi:hypothetical protein